MRDYTEAEHHHTKPSIEDRVFSALSYGVFLFIVPWVVRGRKPFVQSHIQQGIVLFGLELIFFVLINMILGWEWLWFWIKFIFIATAIVGIYYALMGKTWKIPYIGKYGEEIKI